MDLIYQGSVKDIYQLNESELVFSYSDRYSIFDWGEMPDLLNGKGQALCAFAHLFFDHLGRPENWNRLMVGPTLSPLLEKLQKNGLFHHYISTCDLEGNDSIPGKESCIKVKRVFVPKIAYSSLGPDYSFYKDRPRECLVPLEVIFRFGMPSGSSFAQRISNESYCESIDLTQVEIERLKSGDILDEPIIEFSSKLETADRYLSHDEARHIAGLSDSEFSRIKELSGLIAYRLQKMFDSIGIKLWDGKFEFAFHSTEVGRELILVDSIGPDELRLEYLGLPLSKEALRSFYRESAWYEEVKNAKLIALEKKDPDWKKFVQLGPSRLTDRQKEFAENIYLSLANTLWEKYYGQTLFAQAWPLRKLVQVYREGL